MRPISPARPTLLALSAVLVAVLHLEAVAADQPNILLIVTDDQAPHTLSTYGNKVCQTPHLDRLANEGMTLDGAHHMGSWSGAVCTPSRHMIMSGRTVWHIPGRKPKKDANGPASSPTQIPPDLAEFTLPEVFNRAGYITFRTCKKGNSYGAANKRFQIRKDATKRGGDHEKGSGWHGDQAVEFLRARAAQAERQPFLMYLGFSHPHDVRTGREDLLKKYGAVNTDSPPEEVHPGAPSVQINYLPAHPFHHGHPGLRDEERVKGVFTSRTPATVRNELGREYACIENIDEQIGRVLRELETLGELDNTFVIFTADHGIAVGRHGLMGKQNLYEHTWRVPMIVRGPGIQPGSRALGNVYLLDLLPTVCEMTNLDIPKTVEGTSFLPVLHGTQDKIRDVLYGVYCGGTKPGIRCVKRGPWKLIKTDVIDGSVRETQLFNLDDNPDELLLEHHADAVVRETGNTPEPHQVNLADDPQYGEILREMEALLLAEQIRLDDPYRLWNQQK